MARSPQSAARTAPDPVGAYDSGRSPAASLLLSFRPHQWTKNLIVFAGLIFGEQLLDAVWGHDIYVELCTVDVHVRRLRKGLDYDGKQPDLIRTVRSAGYALEENPVYEETSGGEDIIGSEEK